MQQVPTKSILPLSDEQIDQVTNNPPFRMGENREFRAGNIQSVIPADEVMLPADILLGYIITNSIGDRPIFFATTTQAFDELRLGGQVLRQGVAFKLVNGPIVPDNKTIFTNMEQFAGATGPYTDLPRTAELAHNVFVHHKGFPDDFKAWVDIATQQIPLYYAYTHLSLMTGYSMVGDSVQAEKEAKQYERFVRLSNVRSAAAPASAKQ